MGIKISEILPAPERVDVGQKYFEVRGVSLTDIVKLLKSYKEDFAQLLVLKKGAGGKTEPDYLAIVTKTPEMVVDIIALASGNEEQAEKEAISRLPVAVQLIALEKIWKLSVPDVKKIQALLSEAMALLSAKPANALKSVQIIASANTDSSKQG